MPATSPSGYPYAIPADPLAQWPDISRSLAEKVDAEVLARYSPASLQYGEVGWGANIGEGRDLIQITFGTPFSAPPRTVSLTCETNGYCIAVIAEDTITATGCMVNVRNVGPAGSDPHLARVHWVAGL
jgi:hypothetical protein